LAGGAQMFNGGADGVRRQRGVVLQCGQRLVLFCGSRRPSAARS
jgi:hypothetical protein